MRAAQELATDESQLSAALAALDRSREALGVLVGEEGPVEVEQQVTLPAPPAPDDALREAEEKRADVRAQKLRTEAARRVLRDSWADYMPLLSAVLQPFYQTPATVTVPQTGWQAQLVLTLPIFDGGARYGLRRERSALHAEAQADLENLLRQARSDVRAGFPGLVALCRQAGLDLATDRIPVGPAAHYMMGGLATDLEGRTSIPGCSRRVPWSTPSSPATSSSWGSSSSSRRWRRSATATSGPRCWWSTPPSNARRAWGRASTSGPR